MDIKQYRLSAIRPYDNNPRVISDAAVDAVAASIKAYGWRQPIVIDEEGIIIVGHTRFLAANKLGFETVPVNIMTGLSEEDKRAYRIIDNRTGEMTSWDPNLFDVEFEELNLNDDLSAMFSDVDQSIKDTEFLGVQEDADTNSGENGGVSSVGGYVTLTFTMQPDDRDLVHNYLKTKQEELGLENTVQALIEIAKES